MLSCSEEVCFCNLSTENSSEKLIPLKSLKHRKTQSHKTFSEQSEFSIHHCLKGLRNRAFHKLKTVVPAKSFRSELRLKSFHGGFQPVLVSKHFCLSQKQSCGSVCNPHGENQGPHEQTVHAHQNVAYTMFHTHVGMYKNQHDVRMCHKLSTSRENVWAVP